MAARLKYCGSLNGTAPVYKYFPVNDNQTLYAGDIVVLASTKVSAAADAAGAGTVLGVCNTPIVTTTATAADVVAIDVNPASIYEMVYAGSATPAIGAKYDLATAPYTMDSDDTTDGFIQVLKVISTTLKTVKVMLCNRVFGVV